MIKTQETEAGQFFLGCNCPVSRGIVVQEQEPLGELSAKFFLQNVLQLHQQKWVTLRVVRLTLWKIIIEENAVLTLKIETKNFTGDFCTRNFLGQDDPL